MSSFDISLEELRRRQHQRSTTPDEKRKRCPDCGSVDVSRKTAGMGGAPRKNAAAYRCGSCQHHFDNPAPPEEADQGAD